MQTVRVAKKFYQTKEFKDLHAKWRDVLIETGFKDIEDSSGNVKDYNRRTQNFDDRDQLLPFYLALDHYLTTTSTIPDKHRKLLELYASGLRLTDIHIEMKMSYRWCWNWIRSYKRLFLYKD